MCLRIKFCNHKRPGRTKLLKSLFPIVHAHWCILFYFKVPIQLCLFYSNKSLHMFALTGSELNYALDKLLEFQHELKEQKQCLYSVGFVRQSWKSP
jgi:hypothetical protein